MSNRFYLHDIRNHGENFSYANNSNSFYRSSQLEKLSWLELHLQMTSKRVSSVLVVTKNHIRAKIPVCAAKGKKCWACGKIGQ